jgi:hypothetical protein
MLLMLMSWFNQMGIQICLFITTDKLYEKLVIWNN